MPVPAAMVSDSVLDHGPAVVVENPPCGELELSVTTSGVGVVTGRPELVPSVRLMAAEGAPAEMVCGAVANVSPGCVQVLNDFHASDRLAPGRSPTHHTF